MRPAVVRVRREAAALCAGFRWQWSGHYARSPFPRLFIPVRRSRAACHVPRRSCVSPPVSGAFKLSTTCVFLRYWPRVDLSPFGHHCRRKAVTFPLARVVILHLPIEAISTQSIVGHCSSSQWVRCTASIQTFGNLLVCLKTTGNNIREGVANFELSYDGFILFNHDAPNVALADRMDFASDAGHNRLRDKGLAASDRKHQVILAFSALQSATPIAPVLHRISPRRSPS